MSGSSIVVGAYKANVDANNQNQRIFSANIPRNHYENIRKANIESIQFETAELQLIKQLSQIQPLNKSVELKNQLINGSNNNNLIQNNTKPNEIKQDTNKILFEKIDKKSPLVSKVQKTELKSSSFENLENFSSYRSLDSYNSTNQIAQEQPYQNNTKNKNIVDSQYTTTNSSSPLTINELLNNSINTISTENFFERPMTGTRKNVSFNNAIDIRTYPKTAPKYPTSTKNINEFLYAEDKKVEVIESTDNKIADKLNHHNNGESVQPAKSILVAKSSFDNLTNKPTNRLDATVENIDNFCKNIINGQVNDQTTSMNTDDLSNLINSFNFPIINDNTNSNIKSNSNTISTNNSKIVDRGSISSKKKLPGETPVKDLEKTLKMIIIKELSVEKVDGMIFN